MVSIVTVPRAFKALAAFSPRRFQDFIPQGEGTQQRHRYRDGPRTRIPP